MRNTQHGFTLIELLTAVAIVAILAGIATPTLRQFAANSRTTAATNSLVSAFATARSEALRRSVPVTVCASSDSATCTGAVALDWSKGWIAFTDASGATGQLDGTDVLLQAWPAPGANMSVSGDKPTLQYNARGMANLGAQVTFLVWVPGCRGPNQTQIVVTVQGSPHNSHNACPP
jgi:type IV fimbrial biogenesis protein FimT